MKRNTYWLAAVIILVVVVLFFLTGRVDDTSQTTTIDTLNIVHVQMDVSGMVCNGCERLIEKKVKELDGIMVVAASFPDSSVMVSFDSTKTNLDSLSHAIESKGYVVDGIDTLQK